MIHHAPLLYWFPGRLDPAPEYAARFRDDAGNERGGFSRNSDGPEKDTRGCLASPMHDVIVVYRPTVQRWDRIAPGVWLGCTRDATPDLFARSRQYNGYPCTLGDGHTWTIPVANPMAALCSLPAHDVLTDGTWQRRLDEAYTALSERAADLAAQVRAAVLDGKAEGIELPDGDLRQIMADCLALNYDLTLPEMSVLRLFSPAVYWPVVAALIDWEGTRQAMAAAMGGRPGAGGDPFGDSAVPTTSASPRPASLDAGTV